MGNRRRLFGAIVVVAGLVAAGSAVTAGPALATHVACGTVITANTTLDSDVGPCAGDGLVVTAGNVTLDLNGKRVYATNGAGDNAGVRLAGVSGTTVKNGTVEGFDAGVAIFGGSGNTVDRVTAQNNQADGIFVGSGSHDNLIKRNVVDNNGRSGIFLNDPENVFTNVGPTLLDLTSPDRAPYVLGTEYRVMSGSGSGDVTARLVAIDIRFTDAGGSNTNPVDTSNSGCEQADYTAAGFQAGDVALLQRGTCTFVAKVNLALANGASAVVMFNEGQAPNRETFAFGSVGPVPIPVISTTYAVGAELYNLTDAGLVTIHVVTNTTNVIVPAPYDNTLRYNRGWGNGVVDGYDGNRTPPCDNNKWVASQFATVNQACVVGPGGSGAAKGRTGARPSLDAG